MTLSPPTCVGLFAGIGGIELGLHEAGFGTSLLCEIEPSAVAVLRDRFPGVTIERDVRELAELPRADVVAAGFPCQDLSQAGRTAGIRGRNSGLVEEVFRLVGDPSTGPRWLVLENVSNMLSLDKGEAMRYLTAELECLGFNWAYRTVDARSFGVPQRRQRVLLAASREEDPRCVLFADDAGPAEAAPTAESVFGFYWTEGRGGLGWAIDAVPTLKGGSTIGIPSPPAIWFPGRNFIGTPDIRDAERLQGFDADWTLAALPLARGARKAEALRWKLVGNAVCAPMSAWLGHRLLTPGEHDRSREGNMLPRGRGWPSAACGSPGQAPRVVNASMWPVHAPFQRLGDFLIHEPRPLSARAASGFLARTRRGRLRFADGFLDAVEEHLERMRDPEAVAA
jgi:DNA (cytosine-5)-methyltransferase 1